MQAIIQAKNKNHGPRDSTQLQEITDLRLRAPFKDRRQKPKARIQAKRQAKPPSETETEGPLGINITAEQSRL